MFAEPNGSKLSCNFGGILEMFWKSILHCFFNLVTFCISTLNWSGREDSNLRPLAPHASIGISVFSFNNNKLCAIKALFFAYKNPHFRTSKFNALHANFGIPPTALCVPRIPKLSAMLFPLFLASFAQASDFYGVIGAGQARHELNGNGVWYQDGFEHKISSGSATYHAGLGWQALPWLAVEGLYHDFGKTTIDADFVFPDANYNPSTENHCNGPCNPLVHGRGTGHGSGISLSLVPSYGINRDWSIYARFGALWYKRTWEERLTCCAPGTYHEGDLYGPDLEKRFPQYLDRQSSGDYLFRGDGGQVTPKSTGLATIWGVGLNYKSARLEYMGTKGVQAMGSGHTNIGTVSISYRLRF